MPPRSPFTDDVTQPAQTPGVPDELVGIGAGPGQVQGRACVVLDGLTMPQLTPGDILVAPNIGPLWTPLFPLLGGLVLEQGSLGQHAAATAREYGIPAIINCRQATRLIIDGTFLHVDGTAGIVTRIA